MRERDIEAYLVRRVEDLGGEVRKVQWVGRSAAPDRFAMLSRFPGGIWVELKAPGKLATFPADAHERAQHREHERMRKRGVRVVVLDSIEGVDWLLA